MGNTFRTTTREMTDLLEPDELSGGREVERQRHRPTLDSAEIVVDGPQPHGFANQGLTQEEPMALPFDLAIRAHPTYLIAIRVFHLRQPTRKRPRRGRITLRRGFAWLRLHGVGHDYSPTETAQRPVAARAGSDGAGWQ
jgi:hypothetical protein